MGRNVSEPNQVKESAQAAKIRRDRELNDLRVVLSSQHGRRFLWRLLAHCGMYRTSFTGTSETFFLEGQRNVGIWLHGELEEADVESILSMMKENRKGEELNV